MSDRNRIGIFGGSFDPIHLGHLILAEVTRDTLELEKVYFMPTAHPPHKEGVKLTDFDKRKRMVELAIESNPFFEMSLYEESDQAVFTYQTVLKFKEMGYTKGQLHLLIGSDSLNDMKHWKNPDVIFQNATVVALKRPRFEAVPDLPDGASVVWINRGSNSISATEIRELVRQGRSIRYLVPQSVERFIVEHSLYRR